MERDFSRAERHAEGGEAMPFEYSSTTSQEVVFLVHEESFLGQGFKQT